MPTKSDIRKHYNKAVSDALEIVESRAREILCKHSNLDEFIMGMGVWFFTGKDKEHFDDRDLAYLKPFAELFYEWDEYLKLTGKPMRFTAYGKKRTDW